MRRVMAAAFLLHAVVVLSQETSIKFKHITVDDGLSHNYITSLIRDSYGYMWIGTGNSGINKYDGYNFSIYKYNAKDTVTLSNNTINVIYEDFEKKLWVGTQRGMNYYNREFNRFERIPANIDNVEGIYRMKDGNFFLLTNFSLHYYNSSTKSTERIQNDLEITTSDYYSGTFLEISEEMLLIPTSRGLLTFDPVQRKFRHISKNNTDFPDVTTIQIKALFRDSKDRIWIGTEGNGLFQVKIQNNEPVFVRHLGNDPENPLSISSGGIVAIQEDGEGNIWTANNFNGIDILYTDEISNGSYNFIHVVNDPQNEYSLSNNSVNDLFIDDEGTSWVGTFAGGVDYYNSLVFKFNHIKHNPDITNSLNSNNVNVIFGDDKYLWIATDKGLNRYDQISDIWDHFEQDVNDPGSLSSNGIWAITRDNKSRLWVGMWAGGINMYNKNTNSFIHYLNDPDDPESISSNNVFGLTVDNEGYIWVASMGGGLNKFDPETGIFKSYISDGSDEGISTNWTKSVLVSKYGEVWIATGSGADIFNKETEQFSHNRHDDDDPSTISANGVVALYEDSKGTIWVGTEYGINRYNREDRSFTAFTEEEGLANNVVRGILEDKEGNLWISTNKGLSKFVNAVNKPKKIEFKNYYADDGLQADGFNSRTCFKAGDGRLYFGGSNGYNVFDPSNIRTNPNPPKVVLTDFQIFNKSVPIGTKDSPLKKHISLTKEIKLSYKQSVLRIEYAALNLLVPEKNEYAYIMEGFEEEWNYVGTQKFAMYTNLSPGRYTFRVKASNNDGVWNEEGVSLEIRVTPPFWRRIWFIALVLIGIVLLIIRYVRKREEILKRDKQILEEKIQEGLKAVEEQKSELEKKDIELQKKIESEKEMNWYNQGMIKVSGILSEQKDDLSELARNVITELTKYIEVQQGAIYLLNDDDEYDVHLTLTAAYAPDIKRIEGTRVNIGEGQVGTCYVERNVVQVDNLPPGYAMLSSGLGEVSLSYLTLIPVKLNEIVIGVFEFLSFNKIEEHKIEFVQKAGETLTSILSTMKAKDQTKRIVEKQKLMTEELASQEEELRQNLEEMKATQEEASRKSQEAQEREKKYELQIKDLEKTITKLRSK